MNFPKHIQDAPTPRTDANLEIATAANGADYSVIDPDHARLLERQLIWAEEVMEKLYSIRKSRPTVTEEGSSEDYWDCHIDATLTALNEYKQGTKE